MQPAFNSLLSILFLSISIHVIGQDHQGLKFVENKGQWNEEIDFQAIVPGGRLGVSATGFHVQLMDMDKIEEQHLASHSHTNEATGIPAPGPIHGHYFQINLIGANHKARAVLDSPLEGYYNYFTGDDACRWATNASAFLSILYQDVYQGIDFRVSSRGNDLKYDFIVEPGADPSQIKIAYPGVSGIEKINGELVIRTSVGSLTELKPFSYQLVDEHCKEPMASEYRLRNNTVSFSFPNGYDECSELVIDPLLIFSTYSGSTADNWGSTATPGEGGALYSAGVTRQDLGGAFPATVGAFQTSNNGAFDMAIIKYDSTGTKFLYATHLGGANNDSPISLVVDEASHDLLVLGISASPDYPTHSNAFDNTFNFGVPIFNRVLDTQDEWDIVITRLSATGDQLVGSTFLGGSGNDGLNTPKQSGGPLVANYGDEMRGDVITDEMGYVYISSVTGSADFPMVNGFDNSFNGSTDGVVVKMTPDLSSIAWSSYVGGTGFDAAYSIKLDQADNIVLAGGTTSPDFPTTAGAYQAAFNNIVDGWIARIANDGSALIDATLTGTMSFDQIYFIDLNANGDVFCYGQTAGNMPVTPGVYHNPNSGQFLQKFSPDLSTLEFSTVFGSGTTSGLILPNVSPTAFLVNECDNIYLAGWGGLINSNPALGFWPSSTRGMPITQDAYQKTTSGSDFYFMVLNGDASQLVYSTYLGGTSSTTHVDGGTSRFDKFGIVYHAVCSGCSAFNTAGGATSDFPTTRNAHSRINRSRNCNNAAFKFDLSSLRAFFETNNTALTMPGFNNVCYPDTIAFQNLSVGGKHIRWDFGDGTVINQTDTDGKLLFHQYQQEGTYTVKLNISDLATCKQTDSTLVVINYFRSDPYIGDDASVCEGESHRLTASGGVSYTWTSTDGTFSSTEPSPIVSPTDDLTSYVVTVDDNKGCSKIDTVNITLIRDVHASFETYDPGLTIPQYNDVCYPDSLRFINQSVNGLSYSWDFGDGTIVNTLSPDTTLFYSYERPGSYQVKLTALNPFSCNNPAFMTKTIRYYIDQINVVDDGEICEGSEFQLSATGGSDYAWSSDDNSLTSSRAAPVVQPATTTQYYVTVIDRNNCVRKDTVQVRVVDQVDLQWEHQVIANCTGRPSVFVQNLAPEIDDVTFRFDFGDGMTTSEPEREHVYENDGTYSLKFIAQREFCITEEMVQLPVYNILTPNVITPDSSPGTNDNFEVVFGADHLPASDAGLTVHLVVHNRWGKTVFESPDYKNDWNGHGLASGIYYVYLKIGELTTCKDWLHILK